MKVAIRQNPFDLAEFYDFCSDLEVETKEEGIIRLGDHFLGSQKYFFEQVHIGLAAGIHYFVILKARQLGISTACLALDLYWHFKYPGTQGTLAIDSEENRDMFRSTITLYMKGMPETWRFPVESHNRSQLVLGNRSRVLYQVAGERGKVGFGAGKAINFVHATEVGKWGDKTDLSSFEASFAETNPRRLYIFESTAYGFNQFADMWETAEDAVSQRAIFIGWWRNEKYAIDPNDADPVRRQIFEVYWDGKRHEEEKKWCKEVEQLYGYEITDEQIVWHRYTMAEKAKGDEQQMHEKYPPTAEHAFIMTGSQFFSSERVNDQFKKVRHLPHQLQRFVFGHDFGDTTLVDASEKTATLKIWKLPEPYAHYTMGADPAWGSSEWADRFCISIDQCWADETEQVAEFCTDEMNTMQFAWVMLYLAGAYADPRMASSLMMNLELNGPGMAVWSEIGMLKKRAILTRGHSEDPDEKERDGSIAKILMNLQNYLYQRPDSTGGGFNYHTKTTQAEKERMLNLLKDYHEKGSVQINSGECLREMKNVIREDGVIVGAPGRKKDDRVMAKALSTLAWHDFVRVRLIQSRWTREKAKERNEAKPVEIAAGRTIQNYLKSVGIVDKHGNPRGAMNT